MPSFLPNPNVTAVPVGADAVATLQPVHFPRRLAGLTITGPKGSRADIYIGPVTPSARVDQTARGESNSADYASPRTIMTGTPVNVVWPGQAAKAAQCLATFALTE